MMSRGRWDLQAGGPDQETGLDQVWSALRVLQSQWSEQQQALSQLHSAVTYANSRLDRLEGNKPAKKSKKKEK